MPKTYTRLTKKANPYYFSGMLAPSPGILLIADPFLKDPNFKRSVVILCDHQEDGSFGFVLNREFGHTLDELIGGMEGCRVPVYYGGPVQMDTIHFLHSYPDLIPDGNEIAKGIFWGGNMETVLALLRSGQLQTDRLRFFLGYSGWGSGQLKDELNEKSWLTVDATRQLVFHKTPSAIWQDSLRHLGGDYEMMVHFPIDPQLN
jgi:putative transcriptional regulator